MSESESAGFPTACTTCRCYSDPDKYCKCGYRCMILMSTTPKDPIRRFARCKRYHTTGGCDHFEWVDDELCPTVKSYVVAMIKEKENLLKDIEKLEKIKEEREGEKEIMQVLKVKNKRLRSKVLGYKLREKMVTWTLMLVAVAAAIWVGFGICFF